MNQEKKRICLIAPSLQMGGLERAMTTLANFFVTKDHEVFFITLFPFEPFFTLDKRVTHIPCNYKYSRNSTILDKIIFYPKVFSPINGFIRKQVKVIKPNVILCFGDMLPQMSMLALIGKQIPVYISNRSAPNIEYPFQIKLARSIGYFFAKPKGVIAQTSFAAERKRRILGPNTNIKIIPNIVRALNKIEITKKNWIVTIGRLHYEKGIDRLLDAYKRINNPDWELIIVGTGKHEKELKKYSQDLGIDKKVNFLGKVENIEEILSQSSIFVLPSYGEGFPNALCEAMSVGLPCISFDIIAGPRDIIEDNVNGFLVKDGDIDGMAAKINYLIENPLEQVRLGSEAQKITTKFSQEKIGSEYLDFIL